MKSALIIAMLAMLTACGNRVAADYNKGWQADALTEAEIKRRDAGMPSHSVQGDLLECDLVGQMAAASATNPRWLVDIYSDAVGAHARDTCLRMKAARANEAQ